MNAPNNRDRLLADVCAESEPPDFRSALLAETLHLARRRRRIRGVRRASAFLAVVGTLSFVAWRTSYAPTLQPPHQLVRTHPFPASAQISTQPFTPNSFDQPLVAVVVIHTPRGAEIVPWIGDKELLALASPRPAALIRLGPQTQTLIFTDVNEEAGGSP